MLFLKFLSSASLYLLLFGNLAAECVDLSGTYSCEGDVITLSKTSNQEGLFGYSMTAKINGVEETIPFADNRTEGTVPTTTCTGNQVETKFEILNVGTMTITAILSDKTLTTRLSVDVNDGRPTAMREQDCHRQ